MIAICRLWLKLSMAIVLVVGCNVAALIAGAAAAGSVLTADMPCHMPSGKRDVAPSPCGKACLAIPATAPAISPTVVPHEYRYAIALPVFSGLAAAPATPPPRATHIT